MLGFSAPLFGLLALAAGLLWLLHSRRKYREIVPSLTLWRELVDEARPRARARLVPPLTLPFLLQLAAILLLAAALAQPYWGDRTTPDHLVVVLETGASMQAQQDGSPLFDIAREAVVSEFGNNWRATPSRVSVISAGQQPAYIAARRVWSDTALEDGLDAARLTDGPADWAGALNLVPGVIFEDETTEILTVSSAPLDETTLQRQPDITASQRVFSAPSDNSAISGTLSLIDAAENRWDFAGTARLAAGRDDLAITIQYAADSSRTPLTWETISVTAPDDPGEAVPFAKELVFPGPGIVTAFIGPDSNPRDNRLRFVVEPAAEQLNVLYVGDGQQHVLRALDAVGGVQIFRHDDLSAATDGYDLVITDGAEFLAAAPTNSLSIVVGDTILADPDPDQWDTAHPLSRDIDWTALDISTASGLEPVDGETIILAARGVPLITARTTEAGRQVRIGFDPADSNWPRISAFPVFVANLIDWMGRTPGSVPSASCTAGQVCLIDARLLGQSLLNLEAPAAPSATVSHDGFVPQQAGLFRVGQGATTRLIAVNPAPQAPVVPPETPETSAGAWPEGLAPWLIAAALAVLLVEAIVWSRSTARLSRPSALRVITLAMLAAGLFNLAWPWIERTGQTVLIIPGLDQPSESSTGRVTLTAGTVASGPDGTVLADIGSETSIDASPLRLTHTAAAIELAAAMLDDPATGHIVLAGDTLPLPSVGASLAARGIVVDYLVSPQPDETEIQVGRMDLPAKVLPGETVPVTALVHSNSPQSVTMTLSANGERLADQQIDLDQGQNRIEAVLPAIEEGESFVEFSLAAADRFPQNDALGQLIAAAPSRPIAIVSADPAHGEALANLLDDQGLEATPLVPRRAPYYLRDWLEYGAVILLNTPALSLNTLQQTLLETAVRDHGMGLLLLGGPNSFGPGGYFGTALEAMSPLSSRVPQDAPEVAMVFVLDRSGSMQQPVGEGTRLDVAKTATVAATELLNPQSHVGIVVFDAEARTLMPLTRLADDPQAVEQALEKFDAGGGTSIYPGLVEAYSMIRGFDAPAKHLVVMTDGLSQPGDFPGIISLLRAEGVTVSAVAIGESADFNVAQTIAELGGGSAHVTADFAALPAILSQEAMLLASPIEEGVTRPRWTDTSAAFLSNLPPSLPPLGGFVGTTAKPEATLAITATDAEGRDMPILAHWRYGNGLVLALATDATGPWSGAWQALPQYGALWADILRQFQPQTPRPGLSLATEGDGEYLRLHLSALDETGLPLSGQSLLASVTAPNAEIAQIVPLVETRPGSYEAASALGATGRYAISIARDPDTEPLESAYYHSYDAGYDFTRTGGAAALAQATGGRALEPGDLAASTGYRMIWQANWPLWTLLAFALLLIDLALRYLGRGKRRRPASASPQSRQGTMTS